MATFKETSDNLNAVLLTISTKKAALDDANQKANDAQKAYSDAVSNGQSLRQQLMDSLNNSLGDYNSNVRVFGGKTA